MTDSEFSGIWWAGAQPPLKGPCEIGFMDGPSGAWLLHDYPVPEGATVDAAFLTRALAGSLS